MNKILICLLLFSLASNIYGQTEIIDNYIEQALENNLALQQHNFSLQKSLYALREARGMFLPAVSIEGRYSRAGGGRMIDIPIRDLTMQLAQLFFPPGTPIQLPPSLQNQTVPFLREQEQETKVRVVQPVFQPAIYTNLKLKSNLNKVQQAEIAVFKKQLVADVKKAYFNYLKVMRILELLKKTQHLLDENLRVSQKLVQNGIATEEVVFRAKAEISQLEQQHTEAEKNTKLAAAYLNFLMNRPLDAVIKIIDEKMLTFQPLMSLEDAQYLAITNREEFSQVTSAIKAAANGISLATTSYMPGITGVYDYGIQGEDYSFTKDDDYWMASLIFSWNLFHGFQDHAKRKQAVMDKKRLETQYEELQKQIKLQVQEAYDNVGVAQKSIVSANERLTSSQKSFKIISKKYEQGMAPQIEYLNARTALTNAEINQTISRYDYFIKYAEFERIVGI